MVKKILSLLCCLFMLAGMSTALAKEKTAFPDAGVYFRTNEKGAINGNLSVFTLPEGKVFFEVFAMDYSGDDSGLIPAMEKDGEPKAVFAGIIERRKKKTLAHMDFCTNDISDELEEWQYPVNADKTSKSPVRLSYEVKMKTQENRMLLIHVVESLAAAIDTKDIYTRGHSGRVAEYARRIAKRAGYSEFRQEEVYMMGLLHDVGKIGVPNSIINKPASLTDEEFAVIKKHPGMGAQILENIKEDPELTIAAKFHHERFDGKGYPDGLSGFDIPEVARIIAVADAFDAMSSDRSYRGKLSEEKIIEQLNGGKGTQFDPKFADIMISIMKEDTDLQKKEREDE